MTKLIDAEAAKAAIETRLRFYQNQLRKLELRMGCDMSHVYHAEGLVDGMEAAGGIIDALPDASEGRQKAEWCQQHIDQWRKGSENEQAQQAGDGAEE